MDTGVQVLEKEEVISQENLWERLKVNGELIAAITCGVLIFLGWLLNRNDVENYRFFYIYLHL